MNLLEREIVRSFMLFTQPHVDYDGPTALALAINFQPKLVLLDIGIPGLTGYEVARRLKETPETKNYTFRISHLAASVLRINSCHWLPNQGAHLRRNIYSLHRVGKLCEDFVLVLLYSYGVELSAEPDDDVFGSAHRGLRRTLFQSSTIWLRLDRFVGKHRNAL